MLARSVRPTDHKQSAKDQGHQEPSRCTSTASPTLVEFFAESACFKINTILGKKSQQAPLDKKWMLHPDRLWIIREV